MKDARVWLAFGLLCLIWGSSYLFIRIGVRELSPPALVALRLFTGAVAISAIAQGRQSPLRVTPRVLLTLIVLASINTTIPFLLISWGEVTVSSGLATVLNSTVPIFTILLAGAILKDEPLTLPRIGGVALGFAGVVLLLGRDTAHAGFQWSGLAGQGAIILSSICYATGAVATRRTLRGIPSMTIATYSVWIAAMEAVLLSAVFSRPDILHLKGITWLSFMWLGILGSAVAYVLAFSILENWGAARYTLVAYMLPVVGLTLGAIFLKETLDWRILGGSALVVTGIGMASLARNR